MSIEHGGNVFAIAEERGWDWREILDFSANINPLGPSPRVRPALDSAFERIMHYPNQYSSKLAEMLAAEWSIHPERILLGNGATELIHFLARVWRAPRPTIVVPTFSEFLRAWPWARSVCWSRPDEWPDDGLLIVTQPNNPTGELFAAGALDSRQGPVLIDESFIEFTGAESAVNSGHVVLRSLTKFQAIPGLRVGALTGPARLMRKLRARREPWQVNVLAEAAAIEALADRHHAAATRRFVTGERERMAAAISRITGVTLANSRANFLFARLQTSAAALCGWMLERKVLLRNLTGEPGIAGEAVRFAIRSRADNDRLIALWREYACG